MKFPIKDFFSKCDQFVLVFALFRVQLTINLTSGDKGRHNFPSSLDEEI